MDTVKLHQAGFSNTVGISGTALTKEHIHLLRRLTTKIFLCLDADKAGVNATFSSLDSLLNEEVDCKVIQIDGGKDPDEYIESGGDFAALIEHSISPIQFFIDAGKSRYDFDSVVGKTQVLREVLKYVRRMTNRIEVDMSIKYLARSLEISENVVYEELKGVKLPPKKVDEFGKPGLDF
jgi:DNA primase